MYIYKNVKTFVTRETHTHTHKHIKIYPRWNAMSHREGNREGISSGAEREGRSKSGSFFVSSLFRIRNRGEARGDTREDP